MGVPEEKSSTQVVVEECSSPDQQPPIPPSDKPTDDVDGAFLAIVFSAALPCILVLLIAVAVIGVLFSYRVHFEKSWPSLESAIHSTTSNGVVWSILDDWKKHGGNAAMFIKFNPSSLTAIATLTGKIIPYLSSSIMALVAYFAARRIMIASKDGNHKDFLSPPQLTILVELLGGSSFTPLGSCVKHHVKTRDKWLSPIPHAFSALAIVTALGILIPAADTWFSTTVSPVKTPRLYRVTNTSALHQYGRATSDDCTNYPVWGDMNYSVPISTGHTIHAETPYPCNLEWGNARNGVSTFFLDNSTESVATMNGLSEANSMLNYTDHATHTYYYITDPSVDSSVDFAATTVAVQTQCRPMTSSCLKNMDDDISGTYIDDYYNFTCTTGFQGNLNQNGASLAALYRQPPTVNGGSMTGIGFSPDRQLSRMIGNNRSNPEFASFANPLFFGAWSTGYQTMPDGDNSTTVWDGDSEIFYDYYNNYVWLLNCSAEVYNVNYSWVNGSVQDWQPRLVSADIGGIVSFPFVSGMPGAQLCVGIASATQNISVSADDTANSWADRFSECAVSLMAGSLQPVTNDVEQTRDNNFSATRVPLVPLTILLSLKLLYCFAVLILAMAVYHYTDPKKTQSVKKMLTVQGLAASYFTGGPSHQQAAVQSVQRLMGSPGACQGDAEAEAAAVPEPKISVVQTEMGRWEFVKAVSGTAWSAIEPIVEKQVLSQASGGQFGSDGTQAAQWADLLRKGK